MGPVRFTRKNIPEDVKKMKKKCLKGKIIARHSSDVMVLAWTDARIVSMISIFHDNSTYMGKRGGQECEKPICRGSISHCIIANEAALASRTRSQYEIADTTTTRQDATAFAYSLVLGSPIVSKGNKFPYWGFGSSRLDCGDEVRHPSYLVPKGSAKRGLEKSASVL
ncbi:PiggyBac transposable element-derived protein 4 [Eumeta japonica]|uniref:PiggyBac transposable element-derived protein 4 n=1 Tax=Eumeta variegata TaxID=151549 RepID=A0A4C1W9V4_EUMVA|nr:PiggyBac transposable element-derived protein 4 [Eumeta japonica]